MTRAAIYLRVSSEKQSHDKANPDDEKASPKVQESDCRAYCEHKGYSVVKVYSDIAQYRVGKRMVEPSGTRADRPALKNMLADAKAKKFDVIIAWREDRLYRSYRPMLDVLDCLDETKIDIELVKETFDKKIAPVKAWAARMELDAKSDRMSLGIAGRFTNGKIWPTSIPYGYREGDDATGQIKPEESKWVQRIWQWRSERANLGEIRRRLIEGGAPQRRADLCKFPWQRKRIESVLNSAVYWTGIQAIAWAGKTFEIHYPILVDAETARRVREIAAQTKAYPARHVKHDYLAMGLVRCAVCHNAMCAFTTRRYRRKGKPRNTFQRQYRCPNFVRGNHVEGCPHQANVNKVDAELWRKVMLVLSEESNFEDRVHTRVEELRHEEADAAGSIERLKGELSQVAEERHWVITKARKMKMTDAEMDRQLAEVDAHEAELRRELSDKSMLIGDRAGRLIEFANRYRAGLRAKLEWLNVEPRDDEERARQFKARREIVEAIVRTVYVYQDKSIKVEFEFDITPGSEFTDAPL